MNAALDILFYALETGDLCSSDMQQKILFLNAGYHEGLQQFDPTALTFQQHFRPYEAVLNGRGYDVVPMVEDVQREYDFAWVWVPKNRVEAEYLIAQALTKLKEGGVLLCVAANDAGGKILQKMLQKFGLNDVESVSKFKARAVWGRKKNIDQNALNIAIEKGKQQKVLDGDYVSQPGIFGWNKVDKGSEILLQYLPNDLAGKGADFGCGYGYLSQHILQHCADVKTLYAIDADARAVGCCEVNLTESSLHGLSVQSSRTELDHTHKACDDDKRVEVLWVDLTQQKDIPNKLDFIVMNPPFHEGKRTDSDIGLAFIDTAHACLERSGSLWMVANSQLPYEKTLQQRFQSVDKLHEGQGFKVYKAIK